MGIFRFLFYPVVRAGEQLRDSRAGVSDAVKALRKKTAKLSVKGEVVDPAAEFERLYAENEWSAEELGQQLTAVRRTKYFAIASTVGSFFLVLYFMVGVPLWVAFFVLPVALFTIALGMVMTLKFTLFQEQIKKRRLITFKELLSDSAFFRAVFL